MLTENNKIQVISRRSFVGNMTMFVGALLGMDTILSACGKTVKAVEFQTVNGGNCVADGTTVSIEVVHTPNHTLIVPKEDVAAGVAKTYTLSDNGSGHTHEVTLGVQDFLNLQQNKGISEVSTQNASHTHSVTVNCV